MRNFLVIARREYLQRVKTRAFIIMTILLPILMIAATVILPRLLLGSSAETKHYVVVASNANTAEMIRGELKRVSDNGAGAGSGNMFSKLNLRIEISTDTSDANRATLENEVKQKQLDGVIFCTEADLSAGKASFYTKDLSSLGTQQLVRAGITEGFRRSVLTENHLPQPEIEKIFRPLEMNVQGPAGTSNPIALFAAAFALVMIMYLAVVLYGTSVMRAVLEEKTSRVMEVMLSSSSPLDLMAGKILGVGAAGLTQITIWAITGLVFGSFSILSTGVNVKGVLSLKAMLFMGLFFLLGYALYSTLCAAIGAMVNSDQETQQLTMIVMMPLILSLTVMFAVFQSPNSGLSVGFSLFPLTAPIIMFLRIAIQPPPVWEVALSISLIIVTISGALFLCARIYRVGILMYGKRPTLPEIAKWIRYA